MDFKELVNYYLTEEGTEEIVKMIKPKDYVSKEVPSFLPRGANIRITRGHDDALMHDAEQYADGVVADATSEAWKRAKREYIRAHNSHEDPKGKLNVLKAKYYEKKRAKVSA